MIRLTAAALAVLASTHVAADDLYGFAQAERLEYRTAAENALWDFQGRYGGDYHRLWWKTEGEFDSGSPDSAELQLLYSRAWTAYFDLQFGIRRADFDPGANTSLVIGVQGLAPYRFEIDAAAFVSDDGDLSLRAEFERDILLTQKLVLQPRAEISFSLDDVPEIGVGSGVSELAVGLRLRYEFTRKFAPYLGASLERSFGDTADFRRLAGGDDDEATFLAGVRFWF